MDYRFDIADVAAELLTAWTCLDNVRLEALPSFARTVESGSVGVEFPTDLKEIETYQNPWDLTNFIVTKD